MANYDVIHAVSLRIQAILWAGIQGDPNLVGSVGTIANIDLGPPQDVINNQTQRLSVWLYQVVENEFVKNRPMRRTPDEDEQEFPPLALNLLYLLTPNTGNVEADQQLLGRAMQVLYDNARLTVEIPEQNRVVNEEVSIVLCRRTLEELTRIWDALREPYRLSVCYEVRLSPIDSRRQLRARRIAEREVGEEILA